MSKFVRTKAISLTHRSDNDGTEEVLINIDHITYIDIDSHNVYFFDGSYLHIDSKAWNSFLTRVEVMTTKLITQEADG